VIRLEIIANHSVEENILEALAKAGVGKHYTKYPAIFGVGRSGPRMGDAIWPEENFALVIWCGIEEGLAIRRAVFGVKKHFPDEGIKIFGLPEPRLKPPEPPQSARNSSQPQSAPAQSQQPAGPVQPQQAPRPAQSQQTSRPQPRPAQPQQAPRPAQSQPSQPPASSRFAQPQQPPRPSPAAPRSKPPPPRKPD